MLPLNCRVSVLSFNGEFFAPEDCVADDNYWALIGESGMVIETINKSGRVLVKFDNSIIEMGLNCHNPIPNSLYLLETDLYKT
jgi:acetylornithine/N-succinyldiaminopimelate aminotransferase